LILAKWGTLETRGDAVRALQLYAKLTPWESEAKVD
jgi:hypothetical protein